MFVVLPLSYWFIMIFIANYPIVRSGADKDHVKVVILLSNLLKSGINRENYGQNRGKI